VRFLLDHAPDGPDALQRAAELRLARTARGSTVTRAARRHRDAFQLLGGGDSDLAVHPELIRLASVFLDHGQALQAMPHRAEGFLQATAYLFDAGAPEPRGCPGVREDVRHAVHTRRPARVVIEEMLHALGVPAADAEEYLLHTALALPGWTGMFARLGAPSRRAPGGGPCGAGGLPGGTPAARATRDRSRGPCGGPPDRLAGAPGPRRASGASPRPARRLATRRHRATRRGLRRRARGDA
jgi:hypothetical protein